MRKKKTHQNRRKEYANQFEILVDDTALHHLRQSWQPLFFQHMRQRDFDVSGFRMDIVKNLEHDPQRLDEPEGWLHYPWAIQCTPLVPQTMEEQAALVRNLCQVIESIGCRARAATNWNPFC